MERLNILRTRLRGLLRREAVLEDIDEEMRSHVELATETNLERGMRADEAHRAALKSFGNLGRIRDLAYEVRGGGMLDTLWQDLRYASRMLRKNPGFTIVATLTLALGIGANTAIYSVVDSVLLRPLPFKWSERLVYLWTTHQTDDHSSTSFADLKDWKERNGVFEDISGFSTGSVNLTGSDEPEFVGVAESITNLFDVLGVNPVVGRTFSPEDAQLGQEKVVLLSEGLWKRRFGADSGIITRSVELDSVPYHVIGVLPADLNSFGAAFDKPRVDVWFPLSYKPGDGNIANHFQRNIDRVVARLRPGVATARADQEMKRIAATLGEENPTTNNGFGARVKGVVASNSESFRVTLLLVMGAVGLVLIIACVNVTNLLLARAATRMKESAIRAALGASRSRFLVQLLTESMMLALLSGGVGLVIANLGLKAIVRFGPSSVSRLNEAQLDWRILIFALAVSTLTGVLFGTVPALQCSKPNLETLREGSRGSTTGGRNRIFQSLVVAQVGMAVMLLIGAVLLISSYRRLQEVDPGFRAGNVLALQIRLPVSKYNDRAAQFLEELGGRIQALPGVQSAAIASWFSVPIVAGTHSMQAGVIGKPDPTDGSDFPLISVRRVSPNYFSTMGIPLIGGEVFPSWKRRGPNTVVINQTFARKFFGDESPVGQSIWMGFRDKRTPLTVVGVVGDVKYTRLDLPEDPAVYSSVYDWPSSSVRVLTLTQGNCERFIEPIAIQVKDLDGNLPVSGVATMEKIVGDSIADKRFAMVLLMVLAGVALALAATGIYGVISHSVNQRTHEIGVRMALGAQRRDVLRLILAQGLKLVLIGIAIGLLGAFALTRLMEALLFNVHPTDPLTFAAVALLLAAVALLACWIPARRATKVDPMAALRSE